MDGMDDTECMASTMRVDSRKCVDLGGNIDGDFEGERVDGKFADV